MELARTVACQELDAIAADLAEMDDTDGAAVFPVLRAPGEVNTTFGTADDRASFDDDPIRPGERIINGRRYYSAAWL